MKDILNLDTVEKYTQIFGLEPQHPLVSTVDLSKATVPPDDYTCNLGVYAIFLKQVKCGDIRYGRQTYDYQEGTVTSFAPGQIVTTYFDRSVRPAALGLIFHPDLIAGTSLGREIKRYTFFSYSSSEALHLSEEERGIFTDCLKKINDELLRPIDKHSKRLITRNIELLLDYCLRFYERQFVTRHSVNRDILSRFEDLLDDYFKNEEPLKTGLPTVKYFADKICLSPNYFGDLIKKETGKTPQEYIQSRIIETAKEQILYTDKTVSQIAYDLGFQYSQHFIRVFKKNTGKTPLEYRKTAV